MRNNDAITRLAFQ